MGIIPAARRQPPRLTAALAGVSLVTSSACATAQTVSGAPASPGVVSLTGELSGILLLAVPLAFVISAALLALYLRAVLRSMRRRSGSTAPPPAPVAVAATPPVVALAVEEVAASGPLADGAQALVTASRRGRWRVGVVYVLAGLSSAALMTLIYLVANEIPFLPLRTLFVGLSFAWPLVLTLGLVAATSWWGWMALLAGYAALMMAIVAPALSQTFTPLQAILAWLIHNGPATVMVLVFLARRIRAVGPLVMAFTFAAVSGMSVTVNAVGSSNARMAAVAELGSQMGLSGHVTFAGVMLVGAVLLGIAGWLLLQVLGWLYRTRRVSDQTLMIDSLWLMFTIHHAIDLAFAGPQWFMASFAAFIVFLAIAFAAFRLLEPGRDLAPPRLLLLRVFSLGKRSERLFHVFAKLWRPVGHVRMIAGPDLATSTVEPHEFLEFVAGKLNRQFIDGRAMLERRIAERSAHRDVDGRYRVAEFFCYDDTWKMVLEQLTRDSDAILMDLRGFTRANKGCVFEIHALVDLADLRRVVFAVDDTTDMPFLSETLQSGWVALATASPNRNAIKPVARLVRLNGANGVRALMAGVATAARPAN